MNSARLSIYEFELSVESVDATIKHVRVLKFEHSLSTSHFIRIHERMFEAIFGQSPSAHVHTKFNRNLPCPMQDVLRTGYPKHITQHSLRDFCRPVNCSPDGLASRT